MVIVHANEFADDGGDTEIHTETIESLWMQISAKYITEALPVPICQRFNGVNPNNTFLANAWNCCLITTAFSTHLVLMATVECK